MPTIVWKSAVSGNFATGTNWVGNVAPGAGDDAQLTPNSASYTVTASASTTVNSLTSASLATLEVTAGAFVMTNGTNGGTLAGHINVDNSTLLEAGGTLSNSGVITLKSTGNNTDFVALGSGMTLTGGGSIVLGNSSPNRIYGQSASSVLDNVNNTISGAGQLGANQLTFVNETAGVVNASQTSFMQLWVNGGVTNSGVLEDTGTGGLQILNTFIDNTANSNGGRIKAVGAGSHVDLQSSTLQGGTLSTSGGGVIQTTSGTSVFDGSAAAAPVNNTGSVLVNNNTAIQLAGTINNTGTITLSSTGNNTDLAMASPVVTLTGAGQVVMGNAAPNRIYGVTYLNTLDNVNNTISGAGQIGVAQMTLINETAGVINANQTNNLILNVNGGVTNTGLLEDTGTGGLLIQNTSVDNTQNSNAGLVQSNGAGSHVDLQSSTIAGGTLTTTGGGVIQTTSGTSGLDGSNSQVNISTGSNVTLLNNTALNLGGTINNVGTIQINGTGNNTDLRLVTGQVNLTGSGQVLLNNCSTNRIYGANGGAQILDNINNTIHGAGQIGSAQMELINGKLGVIKADEVAGSQSFQTGVLTLNCNFGVINTGLIESIAGGTLVIQNTGVDDSTGGKIESTGLGSVTEIITSTITGGSIIQAAKGLVEVTGGNSNLDGHAKPITVTGGLTLVNNSSLTVEGTIANKKATINLASTGNNTDLRLNSGVVTFNGLGTISLSDNAANRIYTNQANTTLVNVDNTIKGAGQLGAGQLFTIQNQTLGVINSTGANALIINLNGGVVKNVGLVEATNTAAGNGGLEIQANTVIDNTGVNTSLVANAGKVQAVGSHAVVHLQNATIMGGTLSTTSGGVIQVDNGYGQLDGTASGAPVNNTGTFTLTNNNTLYLRGTINNTGVITDATTGNNTDIRINSSIVTLTGGGSVVLQGSAARVYGQTAGAELNNVDNTISGGGTLGTGGMVFVNGGTVDATLAVGITLDTGGSAVTNSGTLEASTSSALTVSHGITNTGNIWANGGTVTVTGAVTGAGSANISSGALLEFGSSTTANTTFAASANGTLRLDAADHFTGTLTGMATGNTIDMRNVSITGATLTYTGNSSSGTLTVSGGGVTAKIKMVGNYSQANFHMANDGGGHVNVTYTGTGLAVHHMEIAGTAGSALIGTAGADAFVFNGTGAHQSDVSGFSAAQGDKIDLSAIDAHFALVSAFSGHSDQLVISSASGGYLVQGDVNGDGKADISILVHSQHVLSSGDFIL
jgi:hypothetical protein